VTKINLYVTNHRSNILILDKHLQITKLIFIF